MKTLNLLVTKLYDNFVYGNIRPSLSQFILAKISVSLIFLYWLFFVVETLKKWFTFQLEAYIIWFYTISYLFILYFVNKYTWSLNQAEEYMNDKENEKPLKKMIWIFWAMLIIPTLLLFILKK